MLDYEAIIKKHDESLIQQIVDSWERYSHVRHGRQMSLEERWEHFIKATNDNLSSVSAASPAAYH